MTTELAVLIFYFPLKVVLQVWLPQYADSLNYMALLFPLFVYEGKMSLLINTYLKTLRKEKLMLIINFISFVLSCILTIITTILLKNLDLAISSIVLLLVFRSVLAELLLAKILEISINKDIILEIIIVFIFVLSGWFIDSWVSVLVYGGAYLTYLLIKKEELMGTMKHAKLFIKA
ncbi:hypothetical protein [Chengkuizengella axinellae]|uniref:Uncharacterized protein n=1 Tax=Chengkuizengella axinellae TaxID=3064388 RepID=A0ABT9IZC6_9BACL|nr:hypothetical protein [Chengkuizengella sp. 2205SS18-9]MDP5274717.1 hypothetical protein [Chengkuizengella sp. 2205SS18-9]